MTSEQITRGSQEISDMSVSDLPGKKHPSSSLVARRRDLLSTDPVSFCRILFNRQVFDGIQPVVRSISLQLTSSWLKKNLIFYSNFSALLVKQHRFIESKIKIQFSSKFILGFYFKLYAYSFFDQNSFYFISFIKSFPVF